MGKLMRLRKDLEEAKKIYKIGLTKAKKTDPLYGVLEKQLNTVRALLNTIKEASKQPTIQDGKNQIYGKGHLLSISTNLLNQICSQLNRSSLKCFALTCNYGFNFTMRGLMTGSFGLTNLKPLKNSQLYSKLMIEFSVLSKFNQFATFSVDAETCTMLFFMFLKKNMADLIMAPRITNISIGPLRTETIELFRECLARGLNISRLKMDLSGSVPQNVILFKNLKELVLVNNTQSAAVNVDAPSLISLTITGSSGIRTFANCKNILQLIYPNESDFNAFNSEKIVLASLRYEQSVTIRPRPIQYLCLNGFSSNTTFGCIDITQYTYESIKVLHLEGLTLNSSGELIKSSCWNNLQCLRLTKLMLKSPQNDLGWILSKCPRTLRVLELVSIPLAGLKDFNTNENGIWLIDLIFNLFPTLEHLILADLLLGPSAANLLMKKLANKQLKRLKVVGFVMIQTLGYNFDQLYQTFTNNYQMSLMLINERQYQSYCEEYNLFKNGRTFLTI